MFTNPPVVYGIEHKTTTLGNNHKTLSDLNAIVRKKNRTRHRQRNKRRSVKKYESQKRILFQKISACQSHLNEKQHEEKRVKQIIKKQKEHKNKFERYKQAQDITKTYEHLIQSNLILVGKIKEDILQLNSERKEYETKIKQINAQKDKANEEYRSLTEKLKQATKQENKLPKRIDEEGIQGDWNPNARQPRRVSPSSSSSLSSASEPKKTGRRTRTVQDPIQSTDTVIYNNSTDNSTDTVVYNETDL